MHQSVINAQNLSDIKILIVVAISLLLSPFIAKFLRLPIAATEIILGAIVAYFGFVSTSENFEFLAKLGFCYLMFIAGMEVNLRSFFNMPKQLAQQSFFYICLLYISSFLFVFIFDLHYVFILIIPVMSVGLLSMLFKEFGKQCYWLNTSMIVATLAELVSIVALTITGTLLRENSDVFELVKSILYLSVFLALSVLGFKFLGVLFWWYPRLKIILMPWEDKNEKDVRFSLALFMLIIVAMLITELELVLGAFIAGAFIATFFNHKKDLEHKLSSFGYGFLIPVFFLYTGFNFDLNMILDYELVLKALFLMFIMLFLRILCAGVFLRDLGFKHTILFALSHSMPLTLLIGIATLSYSSGVIGEELYSALILTALFEAVIVMSLIKLVSNIKE